MSSPQLYAALLCLHLLSAATWVGGMVAMHFAVRPAAVATLAEPPIRLAFLSLVLRKFFAWVSMSVIFLLVTGFWMIKLGGGMGAMHWSVHAMIAIGLLMTLLFAVVRMWAWPGLRDFIEGRAWPAAAKRLGLIRFLVATNLLLGVAVFVVAVFGRAY